MKASHLETALFFAQLILHIGNFQKKFPKLPIENSDKESEEGWNQAKLSKTSTKQMQKKDGRNLGSQNNRKEEATQIP